MNLLADQGLCRILGSACCTSSPYGAGTIDAINRYYGRPDIEISTYYGEGFLTEERYTKYNRYITTHLPNRYKRKRPGEAVQMYRRKLAEQEDESVECIAIGPLNNLSALLDSQPDAYSELNGSDLVRRKVKRLIMMAGEFSNVSDVAAERRESEEKECKRDAEFNVACDIPAAKNVAENWPTPKIYLGFEAGLVVTGKYLHSAVPESHPVRLAYQLHTKTGERYSWDLLTVIYAVDEECTWFRESERGVVRIDDRGMTRWTPDPKGQDRFIKLAQPDEFIAEALNRMLITPPQGGFPDFSV